MANDNPRALLACDCYVGQVVFWVMWIDEEDAKQKRRDGDSVFGWYGYRRALSPEIWSDFVERTYRNGTIMLRHYGKAGRVYKCERDAVLSAYRTFCGLQMSDDWHRRDRFCDLAEAARVLGLLDELEEGLHRCLEMRNKRGACYGR